MVFQPTSFGKYVLLKRIAIGGMAEVFRAKAFGAEGFEKLAAVKRMLPHLSSDSQFVGMFINEAKLAAALNHVNIAQIYDFGCIDRLYFIAMEYVHGKDIADIIRVLREKSLAAPIEMACFLFIEVLNGLDYAHRLCDPYGRPLDLIHRDVSPHNILVSYEGEVKIVDFGIAKAASNTVHTTGGVLKGKYSYMSPEQAHGLALDRRSDIFSLGICFYELLTLTKMFHAESDLGVLEKVRETDFVPPRRINPEIPRELEDILLRALEKNPEDRYPSAAEFRDRLEQFMFGLNLHYSTSWLAGFMREIFADQIEKESREFTEEAEVVKHLRSEARRFARLENSTVGPDTVVLNRMPEEEIDPGPLEPEGDEAIETREVERGGWVPAGPEEPIEVDNEEVIAVEDIEQLPVDPADEYLVTARFDSASPAVDAPIREVVPPIREVLQDGIDHGVDDTGRRLPFEDTLDDGADFETTHKHPVANLAAIVDEPLESTGTGKNPLDPSDLAFESSTLSDRGSPRAVVVPTEREGAFLPEEGRKSFSLTGMIGILVLAAVGGGLVAYFLGSDGEKSGPPASESAIPSKMSRRLQEPSAGRAKEAAAAASGETTARKGQVREAASVSGKESESDGKEGAAGVNEGTAGSAEAKGNESVVATGGERKEKDGDEKKQPPQAAASVPEAVKTTVQSDKAKTASARSLRKNKRRSRRPRRSRTGCPRGKARSAVVLVGVRNGWAYLYVDGKSRGQAPQRLVLSPGRHRITLKSPARRTLKNWSIRVCGDPIKLVY
ncbi:MAG: serine/threonine protein kinase [Deltaproteobacteria bacterium]|nr:MAG: serine/threonine protein kinase [Deltaproteobacteria bacterium]